MIHLSSYHSNGLPTVVWPNKVNLIGEKVYKPKIHFCEYCNKPILIYGRLIPCKHVFCFTCATLCLIQQQPPLPPPLPPQPSPPPPQINSSSINDENPSGPLLPGPNELDITHHQSPRNNHNSYNGSNSNHPQNDCREQRLLPLAPQSRVLVTNGNNTSNNNNNDTKMSELHRSDSNHSLSHRDSYSGSVIMDESTSNTTPNTAQFDVLNSPNLSNSIQSPMRPGMGVANGPIVGKGCHRCGNRVLRVERNTLNSIFVCQINSCRRTYLSARDLQAHFNHRHSRNRGNYNQNHASGASVAAISSSPYISSSSLLHLNNSNGNPSTSKSNDNCSTNNSNRTSPPPLPSAPGPNQNSGPTNHHNNHRHPPSHRRRNRKNSSSVGQNQQQHPNNNNNNPDRSNQQHSDQRNRDRMKREGDRFKERERDHYQKERERERNSKEYHRQSLQRAAQWAEASAQIMEKGLTR